MRLESGKLFVAAGVMLVLVGLLAFGFATPATTIGQETDVSVDQPDDGSDVGSGAVGPEDAANPPASLPNAGGADYASGPGLAKAVLITLLVGVGLSLAGAGALVARRGQEHSTTSS